MSKKLDNIIHIPKIIIGQKFGKLTILSKNKETSIKKREAYYDCICECGNNKVIYGYSIKTGATRSCGCLKIKKAKINRLRISSNNLNEIEILLSKLDIITNNTDDLSWCAGFFDGEGCTTLTHYKKSKTLRLSIAQVEKEPLEKFLNSVKLGKIRGPYKYGTNKQQHYQFNASGVDVIKILYKLWPYLSSVKKQQAMRNIQTFKNYLKEINR